VLADVLARHHHRVGGGEADGERGPEAEAQRLVGIGAHQHLAGGLAQADDAGQVAEIEDVLDRDGQQEIVGGRPEPALAPPDHHGPGRTARAAPGPSRAPPSRVTNRRPSADTSAVDSLSLATTRAGTSVHSPKNVATRRLAGAR